MCYIVVVMDKGKLIEKMDVLDYRLLANLHTIHNNN